ncbi:MAG: D-alanine-D-alanine ligase A [candidate division TM6 bacterium GW2011_GWF2_43_17]|nr:MAG: D-alanine-D-alanine ligase A [candidate division TM6 bacterium GW2011_GWF2_43_17]HAU30576.1 hypothetical protein [Candidatus Dependentiae bacterium]
MNKLRVGIIMGGRSIEREVSFNSGRTICDHLDTQEYDLLPLFQRHDGKLFILPWRFLHRGKISDFEHRLEQEAELITWSSLKNRIDFMYIALHGRYGEDGCTQGFLEVLKIPYFGTKVLGSAIGMNKYIQKQLLNNAGIKTPRGIRLLLSQTKVLEKNQKKAEKLLEENNLKFPLIIKPEQEGSSLGVSKANNISELLQGLALAHLVNHQKPQPALVEEYIEGMEFSCIVITNYTTGQFIALPPTEVEIEAQSQIFDYEQKYMPGRAFKHTPARCSQEIQERIKNTCIATMHALEFSNIGRIDGFVQADGTIVITDPNSFCGMSPSSYAFLQAAEHNFSHTDFINHLIKTELSAYKLHMFSKETPMQKQDTTTNERLRVAILLGGASNEREISLESGRNICYKLSPQKYDITPLFVSQDLQLYPINQRLLVRNKTDEIMEGITLEQINQIEWDALPTQFDFAFLGLHGGAGENGQIQGTLEMLGMPYNGSSVLASALCMDKYKTNNFLRTQGFAVPQSIFVATENRKEKFSCSIPFPVIVKPHDDGCSVMVMKAHNEQELQNALNHIFAHGKSVAMIEEYIVGTEVTIGVLGNEKPYALPPSESIAAGGILSIEEKFLPGAGENQTPARLPHDAITLIQHTVEQIYQAIGCRGYVRMDCFYQNKDQSSTEKERVVLIEINTLPGLTPATCLFHQAAEVGIKPMELIDLIVEMGLAAHTSKQDTNFTKLLQKNIKSTEEIHV